MARPSRKELIKGFLASLAFIAVGLYMRWAGVPGLAVWPLVIFGAIGIAGVVYNLVKAPAPGMADSAGGAGGDSGVVLRDGHDYRVDVTDTEFVLTHKSSGEVSRMAWGEVTFVSIIAIDNWPIGGISFLVHGGVAIEVPWNAEGNAAFLATMVEKLPGFDNAAVVQASGMLHGFKQVWPPDNSQTPP